MAEKSVWIIQLKQTFISVFSYLIIINLSLSTFGIKCGSLLGGNIKVSV